MIACNCGVVCWLTLVVLVVCVDYVCLLVLLVGYSWFGLVDGVVWYVGRWFVVVCIIACECAVLVGVGLLPVG